jgi:hypothetical protein
MRPNFEAMTNKELVAYAYAHREDAEPLRVLYRRRTPDEEATWYGPFLTLPTAKSRGILASQGFQRIYPQQAS